VLGLALFPSICRARNGQKYFRGWKHQSEYQVDGAVRVATIFITRGG
jgi:hypothetical protein